MMETNPTSFLFRQMYGCSSAALPLMLIFLSFKFPHCCVGASKEEDNVESHLEMGKKMFAQGQYADALSHYHAAVEADPSDGVTLYRRATVYMAMGKTKSAIPDLKKVTELKPNFHSARSQLANVFLKQGSFSQAKSHFSYLVDHADVEPNVQEGAKTSLAQIASIKNEIEDAEEYIENSDYFTALPILSKVIEICPWDGHLRHIRANAYVKSGELIKAIGDLLFAAKLIPDNTKAYLQISELHYILGEAEESLMQIRECLKLDPDHQDCFKHYKKVKKLVKQHTDIKQYINDNQWEDCVQSSKSALKTEPHIHPYPLKAKEFMCKCYSKSGNLEKALEKCDEVLSLDSNNLEVLCDKAEAYITVNRYDEAIQTYQQALGISNDYGRAREGMERAQKLLKQSKKRDYYKILGVKRTAHKRDILKAYRRLAMKWHPDKFDKPEERKKAENTFIDIAAAKEVLTNPEKRQKFDNGEDPLDAEAQSHGGNPFFHDHDPFGGGNFQFKFHFG